MSNSLGTYLEDHLAAAGFAIDLLRAIGNQFEGEPLGQFARELLVEVEADRRVLKELSERVGTVSSGLKGISAWLAEKVSRLKLKRDDANGLGTFEALEFLTLGIQGKLALWQALEVVRPGNARLENIDFRHLAERAQTQYVQMEERRLEAAVTALRSVQE